MISDEAVEAAAKGIWEARPMTRVYEEGSPNYGAAQPWDEIKQYHRDRFMTLGRASLEAAAPYMLAARYDQGGFLEPGVSQVVNTTGKPIAIQPNPYRSQP
jgi:hypothetical protein